MAKQTTINIEDLRSARAYYVRQIEEIDTALRVFGAAAKIARKAGGTVRRVQARAAEAEAPEAPTRRGGRRKHAKRGPRPTGERPIDRVRAVFANSNGAVLTRQDVASLAKIDELFKDAGQVQKTTGVILASLAKAKAIRRLGDGFASRNGAHA